MKVDRPLGSSDGFENTLPDCCPTQKIPISRSFMLFMVQKSDWTRIFLYFDLSVTRKPLDEPDEPPQPVVTLLSFQ